MTGPSRGPMAKIAIAPPLSCGMKTSAIEPAPIVMGQLPAIPAKRRKASKAPMFGAKAHAIVQTTKSELQMW